MKLQGLDDKLDGKIGVLKKLDAATGKFEVALVDEASVLRLVAGYAAHRNFRHGD